jgi:hypothetical protein
MEGIFIKWVLSVSGFGYEHSEWLCRWQSYVPCLVLIQAARSDNASR